MHNTIRILSRKAAASSLGILVALAFALAALPATAYEGYGKSHGSMCKPYYDSQASDFIYGTSLGIRNVNPTLSRWVICPLTRHGPYSYVVEVGVVIYTRGGTNFCELSALDYYGQVEDSSSASDSSRNRFVYLRASVSYPSPRLSLRCLLPPKSDLRGITVWEPN